MRRLACSGVSRRVVPGDSMAADARRRSRRFLLARSGRRFPVISAVTGLFRTRNTGAKNRPYNCHRTSSNRVFFHIMRRRFMQVFVASKALNHLQLSLTIARIC
ncbi:hypothetical protein F01_380093 [Burkholderia cenocepacia]|nr:hypothetical protein F01_380093 [Burkholderia cenocepacia]